MTQESQGENTPTQNPETAEQGPAEIPPSVFDLPSVPKTTLTKNIPAQDDTQSQPLKVENTRYAPTIHPTHMDRLRKEVRILNTEMQDIASRFLQLEQSLNERTQQLEALQQQLSTEQTKQTSLQKQLTNQVNKSPTTLTTRISSLI